MLESSCFAKCLQIRIDRFVISAIGVRVCSCVTRSSSVVRFGIWLMIS